MPDSVANVLLQVTGDSAQARRELERVARELAEFGRETAEADAEINTTEARAHLDELKAKLDSFAKEEVTAEANVKIAKALGEIQVLQAELDRIDHEDVTVDIDVRRGVTERLAALFGQVENLATGIEKDLTPATASASEGFSLMGVGAEEMTAAAPAVIAVITALVAAVGALVASLSLAVAGIGALGVAAVALLLPGLGLLIGAIKTFKAESGVAGTAANALSNAFSGIGSTLSKAFGPGINAVFRSLADALRGLNSLVKELGPGFTAFGKAVGKSLGGILDSFKNPIWGFFFAQLLDAATKVAPIMGQAFSSLAAIFRNIASAALPFLISGLQRFSALLKGLSVGSINLGPIISQLQSWLALAGQLGRVFLGFIRGAAGPGQQLVDWLTRGAKALGDWLNSAQGQAALKRFFTDTLPLAQQLVTLVLQLSLAFLQMGQLLAPLFTPLTAAVNFALGLLNRFLAVLNTLPGPLRAIGLIGGTLFAPVVASIGVAIGAFRLLPGVARAVWDVVKGVFSAGASAVGRIVSAAVGSPFHWVADAARNVAATVRGIISALVGWIKGRVNDAISVIGNIGHAAAAAASKVADLIGKVTDGAIKGAAAAINAIGGAARSAIGAVGSLIDTIGSLADKLSSVPGKVLGALPGGATGFRDFAGGLALVGERGPEIVNLPSGSDVFTATDTRAILESMASGVRGAVVPNFSTPSIAPRLSAAGGDRVVNVQVVAPAGEAPDVEALIGQINSKMRGLGAFG